jgi:signal transduction histidine kinase
MPRPPDRTGLAFGVTLVLLGMLGAWWTVLIGRLLSENHALKLASGVGDGGEHARRQLMLLGESATLSILAVVLVGSAWRLAARERASARRLEAMLAASTHELKTPIAGIRLLLESLASGVVSGPAAAPHLAAGLDATARLEHLVEGILTWQAGIAREAPASALRLGELLATTLAQRPAEPTPVDLGELAETPVLASPDAFRVILDNLLDNARKHGGTARVSATPDGGRVRLEVADDGPGFDPALAETLFEPYARGGAKTRGTGLGLYIARVLARQAGGDLDASSDGPGRGATFRLWLRRAP